jgi:hypothetical protein
VSLSPRLRSCIVLSLFLKASWVKGHGFEPCRQGSNSISGFSHRGKRILPQRLKPDSTLPLTARLKAVPLHPQSLQEKRLDLSSGNFKSHLLGERPGHHPRKLFLPESAAVRSLSLVHRYLCAGIL